jgi:hypothetical protein
MPSRSGGPWLSIVPLSSAIIPSNSRTSRPSSPRRMRTSPPHRPSPSHPIPVADGAHQRSSWSYFMSEERGEIRGLRVARPCPMLLEDRGALNARNSRSGEGKHGARRFQTKPSCYERQAPAARTAPMKAISAAIVYMR